MPETYTVRVTGRMHSGKPEAKRTKSNFFTFAKTVTLPFVPHAGMGLRFKCKSEWEWIEFGIRYVTFCVDEGIFECSLCDSRLEDYCTESANSLGQVARFLHISGFKTSFCEECWLHQRLDEERFCKRCRNAILKRLQKRGYLDGEVSEVRPQSPNSRGISKGQWENAVRAIEDGLLE